MRAQVDMNDAQVEALDALAKRVRRSRAALIRAVSIISWMEVMVGARIDLVEPTRRFLEGFKVIALDDEIASRAVELRRAHRIKLTDAVIWATAQTTGRPPVTRHTEDFPHDDPGIREPYVLYTAFSQIDDGPVNRP